MILVLMVIFPWIYHALCAVINPLVFLYRKIYGYLTSPPTRVVRVGGGNIIAFLAIRGVFIDILDV